MRHHTASRVFSGKKLLQCAIGGEAFLREVNPVEVNKGSNRTLMDPNGEVLAGGDVSEGATECVQGEGVQKGDHKRGGNAVGGAGVACGGVGVEDGERHRKCNPGEAFMPEPGS